MRSIHKYENNEAKYINKISINYGCLNLFVNNL